MIHVTHVRVAVCITCTYCSVYKWVENEIVRKIFDFQLVCPLRCTQNILNSKRICRSYFHSLSLAHKIQRHLENDGIVPKKKCERTNKKWYKNRPNYTPACLLEWKEEKKMSKNSLIIFCNFKKSAHTFNASHSAYSTRRKNTMKIIKITEGNSQPKLAWLI